MDYYEDCLFSIMRYTDDHGINLSDFSTELKDKIVHNFYKNYYSYEMDEEYAAQAAISAVIVENNIKLDGFEIWLP